MTTHERVVEEHLKHLPKLTELELAVAIDACREAGAVNAAESLSKYISRLQIELSLVKAEFKRVLDEEWGDG